jgi:hypothetical protein
MHKNEHQIRLKVNGKEKVIWVNSSPIFAQAVNGLQRSESLKNLRAVSRWLSNLFTTYSLNFSIRNLFRDTMYSRMALMAKESRAYRQQFRKNWRKNFGLRGFGFAYPMVKMMAQWERGTLQVKAKPTERERMFMDFMRDGGATGYTIINSVDRIKKDLERVMRRSGDKVRKYKIPILSHYASMVETLNEGFELLTRFTAYQTSRQMGRSGQRAAKDAKEISVNFNRQGAQTGKGGFLSQLASYMGATHYFYNAGVQGFDNFLRLFKVAPWKMSATMVGFQMLGALTPLINSMLAGLVDGLKDGGGDDDNDEWYWDLPQWVRRNNIVLGIPGFYICIPLAVELRAPFGLGDIAASFMYDKVSGNNAFEVGLDVINTASGVLPVNPVENYESSGVGVAEGLLRTFFPDAGMFIIDAAFNRDYTGRPLGKENPFSDTKANAKSAYASTPEFLVKAAQWLAENTADKGVFVDLSPGQFRNAAKSLGGGFYKVFEDLAKNAEAVASGGKIPWRYDNVPFFSGFTGHLDEDRRDTFEKSTLNEYKELEESVMRRLDAAVGADEKVTPKIAFTEPEKLPQAARVQTILEGKDYILAKMYYEGINNKTITVPTGEYFKSGKRKGQPKTKQEKILGVNGLKDEWKAQLETYYTIPKGPERDAYKIVVDNAWQAYYDAACNLCDRLLEYENENTLLHMQNTQAKAYEGARDLTESLK